MHSQPPTYRLVSWPVRIVVAAIAIGGAWTMLEGWAAGVRLAKMMSALGERAAAAEVAALKAKRAALEDPGEPGVIYLDPHPSPERAPAAPPKPR